MIQAQRTDAGRYYRPELDVVRFLAFLLVFLHHSVPLDSDIRIENLLKSFAPILYASAWACGFGLSLFFTLSAFLICELLLREREAAGSVDVKQFYLRRILRIWPLYYLGLALGAIVMFLPGGHPEDVAGLAWFSLFMGAWYKAAQHSFNSPARVLWSVSVEEQFYVFAPWVVKHLSRKWMYGFCLLLIFISNVWLFHLGKAGANDASVWFNSFVQFESFAAGILLCLVLHGRLPRFELWQRLMLLAGAWACWFYACYRLNSRMTDGNNPGSLPLIGGYALATLGSVLVLVAFLGANPKRMPGWAIYLGRISFGLYVYHDFTIYIAKRLQIGAFLIKTVPNYPLRVCLNVGLGLGLPLALTLLIAALSYRYFETPFLKMKKRHSIIESQPIADAD
jgi:peptidoglycan/LPS O-acetylase OafA/YrhL